MLSKNGTITLSKVRGEEINAGQMSSKRRVLRATELINRGDLHYVRLEFDNVPDPKADFLTYSVLDGQRRVVWDGQLWCPLVNSAASILECCQGVTKENMKEFSDKLASGQLFPQNQHDEPE
jgi:hypothetical protein